MKQAMQIHPNDTVAVALTDLTRGSTVLVGGEEIILRDDVRAGHKFALRGINAGESIFKYGCPIGTAKVDILKGDWVHSHNLKSSLGGLLEYSYHPNFTGVSVVKTQSGTFWGYRRPDGRVGIRNEIWIIPTVGCVNAVAKEIENQAQQYRNGSIDGIFSYSHPYGCSQLGDDQLMTQKFLSGLIRHPNAGGVLVLGLGCENNNIPELKKVLGEYDKSRVRFLNCQDSDDEVAAGASLVRELCETASRLKREECSVSELVVGLKCGGSDGFSGITANPLVGAFSDLLTAGGGSVLLTEVPEMFGAEQLLMNRCRSEAVFEKTVGLINNFKSYFMRYGERVDENPSPGNKEGGITTLEEKSLGCVQKAGSAPVEDVLSYGEPASAKGLSLLQGPGNDLVASCALAASGAVMVLFTTGRGTPFGCPVPTLKISSNTPLAEKKRHWIDYNAGRLLSGSTMEELASEFYGFILRAASGEIRAKSEALDKRDLSIFKDGVTL